jgi:VanZ family protein
MKVNQPMTAEQIKGIIFHPATQLLLWLQFAAAITIFTYFATATLHIPAGNTDSFLHFTGNFLLFLSARLAFLKFKGHWFVLAFALIYGTAMEAFQHILPSRYFDPQDLVANWLGVFAGLALALLIELIFKRIFSEKR